MTQVETKVDSEQLKVQANSGQYCAKQQVLACGFYRFCFLVRPPGKVMSREDHWLRFLLPAGVKFRVGCGSSLTACHCFRGGRALWVSPVGKPRRAGPVGKPCGQALLRGIFL